MTPKQTCPECNLIFEATPSGSGALTCPLCDTVFSVRPPTILVSTPAQTASVRQAVRGCLAVGAILLLAGGLLYAYHLAVGIGHKDAHVSPPTADTSSPPATPVVIEVIPMNPLPPQPIVKEPTARPQLKQTKTMAIAVHPRAPLTLNERVNQAIERGVVHLRRQFQRQPRYCNYQALLGLTLLECGAPANDPSVQQIASWLRARELNLTTTYELTLAILFLDRLGETRDRPLIRNFGQRLLSGQLEGGTWTYSCLASSRHKLPAAPSAPFELGPQIISGSSGTPIGNRKARERPVQYHGDNSNTQFALLGLWVAQRHGVLARPALLASANYFRAIQLPDGSWPYHARMANWRDSMTCAGLMSLAFRYGGINGQGRDIRPAEPLHVHDSAITRGLQFLGQSLAKIDTSGDRIEGVEARDPLYFLWSLERMAVIYDLKTIGEREWYPWAAEMLVTIQQADGSWHSSLGGPVGTCFALLVLRRSNLAADLQLAVQNPAPLGLTTRPRDPVLMPGTATRPAPAPPLGPGIATSPSGNRPETTGGVMEIPIKKP